MNHKQNMSQAPAYLVESFWRNHAQNYGLHGWNITKSDFRDVQSTNNMCPTCGNSVCAF
jgi:hypothetical protein